MYSRLRQCRVSRRTEIRPSTVRRETLHWRKREYINYDVLLLPLSSDGRTVDMLVGLARYHAK